MTSAEIRQKFLDFFASREHGNHTPVTSSSLIPDDPSVLLTTAGMQQFKKYYNELDSTTTVHPSLGKPIGKNAVSCQKSFRTSDIDEVGDERHLTFFEMLGNFSFGGYFKKEAIAYAHEFITNEMELIISYVSIFEGKDDIGVPRDTESEAIWKSLDPNIKVVAQGMDDVFWGPTGSSGPCGPTTEIYCKNGAGQDIEIWNIVFNQYFYPGSREELNSGASGKKLEPLKTPGVDTGMGLERLVMVKQGMNNIFETDLFIKPFGAYMVSSSGSDMRSRFIFADHIRGAMFLIGDGVRPSNKGAGYILRRLMRRAIIQARNITDEDESRETSPSVSLLRGALESGISFYRDTYDELRADREKILTVFEEERSKFTTTLDNGLREFYKRYSRPYSGASDYKLGQDMPVSRMPESKKISGEDAFHLHQSFGLTIDIIRDLARDGGHIVDEQGFEEAFKKHQEISRAGSESKFGGHGLLLDTGEIKAKDEHELKIVTRLHTATHMLQQALRDVLGPEVKQAGSDITAERTRFDFTFGRKLTPEEIAKVEARVNEKIKDDLPVTFIEMPRAEAEKTGALYFFKAKYGDRVKVYYMGHDVASAWSKEFCGGPHVSHTSEVGKFKIAKEEAVSAGVRRVRGIVE